MRLDEYQKWLDAQFLDNSPLIDAAAVTVEEPQQASTEDIASNQPAFVLETTAVVEQFDSSTIEEAIPAHVQHTQFNPVPVFVTRDTSADETDVPSIENYLPFLKPGRTDDKASIPDETDTFPVESDQAAAQAVVEFGARTTESIQEAFTPEEPVSEPPEDRLLDPAAIVSDPTEGHHTRMPAQEGPDGSSVRRGRRVRTIHPKRTPAEITPTSLWTLVPKHIQVLVAMGSDEVAQNSYKRAFKESRIEMINHLLDPTLSLEDTARLLNVCPTTVRRYTNRGLLTHQRTKGDQRRFKLSDVLAFLEAQTVKD